MFVFLATWIEVTSAKTEDSTPFGQSCPIITQICAPAHPLQMLCAGEWYLLGDDTAMEDCAPAC